MSGSPPEPRGDAEPCRLPLWFAGILVLLAAYCGSFILHSSALVRGQRYFYLLDDMMISMQYARNLAHGAGLVYNAGGEAVEGYNNPLWVLYLALLHLTGLPDRLMSLLVQLSGFALLVVNLCLVRRLATTLAPPGSWVPPVAGCVVAFSYPLVCWALLGTEVIVLAVVATWGLCQLFDLPSRSSRPWVLWLVLGVTSLVRPDAVLVVGPMLLAAAWVDRRRAKQHLWLGGGCLMACVAGWTLFRWVYYHDILPNTYYLKLTGWPTVWRISAGLHILLHRMRIEPAAALLMMIGAVGAWRVPMARLIIVLFGLQVLYCVWVGGDVWENQGGTNRFLSVLVAPLLVVMVLGFWRWAQDFGWGKPQSVTVPLVVALVAIVALNAIRGPRAWEETFLHRHILETAPGRQRLEAGLLIADLTDPQATVANAAAGIIPYFARRNAIDLLGKCDAHVSRVAMRLPQGWSVWKQFVPGHMKRDYAYSVGQLKPDIITEIYRPDEAALWLVRDYRRIRLAGLDAYLRRESPHIRWERVDALAPPAATPGDRAH